MIVVVTVVVAVVVAGIVCGVFLMVVRDIHAEQRSSRRIGGTRTRSGAASRRIVGLHVRNALPTCEDARK